MSSSSDPLSELLRRVRRRAILAQVARAAVGAMWMSAAAIAGLLIVSIFVRSTNASSMFIVAAIPVIFVAAAAIRRPPDDRHVAMHIDREMNLHELLASSLATPGDDAPARSLRAMASQAASGIEPAEVPVNAPSARRAMAAALALGVTLLCVPLMDGTVRSSPTGERAAVMIDRGEQRDGEQSSNSSSSTEPRAEPRSASVGERETRSPVRPDLAREASESQSRGQTDNAGGTAGATNPQAARVELGYTAASPTNTPSGEGRAGSSASAGAETTSSRSSSQDNTGTVEEASLQVSVGTIDANAREVAAQAIAAGTVPARCRDIVRAYFDLPTRDMKHDDRSARP